MYIPNFGSSAFHEHIGTLISHIDVCLVDYMIVYMYAYMYVSYGSGSEVEEKVMSVRRERIPLAASQPLTDTL